MSRKTCYTFCIIFLLCLNSSGIGQTILTGQVVDSESKEPIPYAHLVYLKKSIGTTSNLKGFFQLALNNPLTKDSLIIKSVGYKSLKLAISDFTIGQVFELTASAIQLDDVTVLANKEKFNLDSFMLEVVKQYNQQRKKEAHVAKMHFQESASLKGKYIMYFQSLGYSLMAELTDNRPEIGNYNLFYENTRAYIEDPSWAKYDKKLNDEYNRGNTRPSGLSLTNFFRRVETRGLLSLDLIKNYKFKMEGEANENSRLLYRINYKWKGDKGIIEVDAHTLEVVRILSQWNKFFSNPFSKTIKANSIIEFAYYDQTPYPSVISANYTQSGLTHILAIQILSQKFSRLELSNQEFASLTSNQKNPYIEYDSSGFKFLDKLGLGPTDQMAIDLIGSKQKLESYFQEYSGRWLRYSSTRDVNSSTLVRDKLTLLKQSF